MKKMIFVLALLISISSANLAKDKYNLDNKNQKKEIVPGTFIVKFKKGNALNKSAQTSLFNTINKYNVSQYDEVFKLAKNEVIKEKLNLGNVYQMETSFAADIWKIVTELNDDPNIEYAEPVFLDKFDAVPNDALYPQQQHLPQIHAPEAWDIQYGSSNVIIGIIDSGVDWDHEDLAGVIWTNSGEIPDNGIDDDNNGYIDDIRGWDFVTARSGSGSTQAHPNEDGETPDNNPMDFDGHGTHVSGIAAGQTNNNIGIASVSSGAKIMPLRCGYHANDGLGYVPSNFCADAYIYAADNGANITNQSSGNSGQLIVDAARYAFMNGVLIIESAGNGDGVTPSVLGAQSWVMSIGSVNGQDQKTYYSSFGKYVTVSAPGGEIFVGNESDGILSTVVNPSNFYGGEKYVRFQGTSMAAPLVASLAGLIKSHEPGLSVVDLFTRIQKTADNIDAQNPDYIGMLGGGRINAYRALTETVTADPNFIIDGQIIDDAAGNGNGILDPGETVTLKLKLRNIWQNAENVSVNVTSTELSKITINSGSVSLGNVTGITDTSNWRKEVSINLTCTSDALPSSVKLLVDIASSGYNQSIDYYLSISPRILFVADFDVADYELLDFSPQYFSALGKNSISFDFVHRSKTAVDYNLLSKYKIVIWACEWSFPSLNADDRNALKQYLDGGGSLFLSGQDIGWELNESVDNQDPLFFNNYLKSDYIADNAGRSQIFGIVDDPISDGLSIDFYQENRDISEQFPDAIAPRESAASTLKYDFGSTGAIRYAGNFRLVYFAFGGFESITDEQVRNTVMARVIDYLDGIEIDHTPLKDAENTTGEYTVNIHAATTNGNVSNAFLFWSADDGATFNKINMTDLSAGNFQAGIPAQTSGTIIKYFVFVNTDNGNYSNTKTYSFNIGLDTQAPIINFLTPYFSTSVNAFGPSPYEFSVLMDDNMGIDTASAKLFFWVNSNDADSVLLTSNPKNIYKGTFSFTNPLQVGDQVKFYFKVNDISSSKNIGISDTSSFMIDTLQILDGFESGTNHWDLGDGWGLAQNEKNSGSFSITDSPFGDYADNSNNSLMFKYPFNLSIYKYAELDFYVKHFLENGVDSVLVEVTNNGGATWTKIDGYTGGAFSFRSKKVKIPNFTGTGNENVMFRFRVASNDTKVLDGVYIDDVSIKVSYLPLVTGIGDESLSIPNKFSLAQNFPNPFNPTTSIQYEISSKQFVSLKVFNVLGKEIKVLVSEEKVPGSYKVNFDASELSTGVYFYRMQAGNFVETRKMILLK